MERTATRRRAHRRSEQSSRNTFRAVLFLAAVIALATDKNVQSIVSSLLPQNAQAAGNLLTDLPPNDLCVDAAGIAHPANTSSHDGSAIQYGPSQILYYSSENGLPATRCDITEADGVERVVVQQLPDGGYKLISRGTPVNQESPYCPDTTESTLLRTGETTRGGYTINGLIIQTGVENVEGKIAEVVLCSAVKDDITVHFVAESLRDAKTGEIIFKPGTVQWGIAARQANTANSVSVLQTPLPKVPENIVQGLSPVFTPEVQYWRNSILHWAAANGLDPNLVATVMQIESCGDPRAGSGAGAQGLFQVMPFHFNPGEDMSNPDINAMRGLKYLKEGLELAGGDVGLALAGYNGGHSVMSKGWAAWVSETRRYYRWGLGAYLEASSGAATSPTLQDWLNAGGRGLCKQAHDRLRLSSIDSQNRKITITVANLTPPHIANRNKREKAGRIYDRTNRSALAAQKRNYSYLTKYGRIS